MARLSRIVLPGHPHVIIHRARCGESVFRESADGDFYRSILLEAARDKKVAIHAYNLWPGEVKMLASPDGPTSLADLMQTVGRRYVPYFNRKYGYTGTPWEGRFRSTVIEVESYFLPCLRYVESVVTSDAGEANPSLPTSAAHHLGSQDDVLVNDHAATWALGNTPFERQAAYRRFLAKPIPLTEESAILLAALNGWALGSMGFVTFVGEHCGRRSHRTTAGRPKKFKPGETDLSPF